MKQIFTNEAIYNLGNSLIEISNDNERYFPAKVGFFIEKNKQNIIALMKEIEEARIKVIKEYGSFDEETQQYIVEKENIEQANKELIDLLQLEQEIEIYTINIDNLDGLNFNSKEIQALMFMLQGE